MFGKTEMNEEIMIVSYFSLPTDLAGEMRGWPEFVGGKDYTVDLRDPSSGEKVMVRFVEPPDDQPHVSVKGTRRSVLFEKVVGRVIWALSKHSDDLMIDSREIEAEHASAT